jgi:hypothetical protein
MKGGFMLKNNQSANEQQINIEQITVKILPNGRFTATEAAKYVGLSYKTLASYRCNGTGPAFIKQGGIFYRKEDLDNWLNEAKPCFSTAQARQLS